MRTDDKTITTPEYWDKIYRGENDNARVDASNTQRPKKTFDRFSWVAAYADGPCVLGVASGHAHIEKRIKAAHPTWHVVASDQAREAVNVAGFVPYWINSAYMLPNLYDDGELRKWNTIIISQALEYIEDQERFIKEAQRCGDKLLITVPIGEMPKWSQLRIYTEENVRELLEPYGTIEIFERQGDLLLAKLKFK